MLNLMAPEGLGRGRVWRSHAWGSTPGSSVKPFLAVTPVDAHPPKEKMPSDGPAPGSFWATLPYVQQTSVSDSADPESLYDFAPVDRKTSTLPTTAAGTSRSAAGAPSAECPVERRYSRNNKMQGSVRSSRSTPLSSASHRPPTPPLLYVS